MKSHEWPGLVTGVANVIRDMPLNKLQNVGGKIVPFLYEHPAGANVVFMSGVTYMLRQFHGQIQNLVQGAWVRHIRRITTNQPRLGEIANLDEFLFGSERAPLIEYRTILHNYQDGCFYCGRRLTDAHVDHFIPWIRYPLDLGHNFVLAHASCNTKKRDSLAVPEYRDRWESRNKTELGMVHDFDSAGLPHNLAVTQAVADWAYARQEIDMLWSP